ncbi:MAG TPA: hypothetical protein VKG01_07345 [Thermoanaerobaculia bacterium]|nr:hypothetical protein [Thermoanaerobaculia bacterium]
MVWLSPRRRRLVLAAATGVAAAVFARGQQPDGTERKWATIREGGLVTAVAIDPNVATRVYASSARSVFASDDGGHNWVPLPYGTPDLAVTALAVDPGPPSVLYVGTNGGGVLRGNAGNSKFTRVGDGGEPDFVSSIVFDPATRGRLYLGTNQGVFRSDDTGAHWKERNSGLTNVHVTCVVLDPRNPSILYAGTNAGGIFRSADGAATWTAVNAGLTSTFVWSLAFGGGSDSALYAATYDGLFRSSPPGSSWTPLSRGMRSTFVLSFASDPDAMTLYAGTAADLYRSKDAGATWESASRGLTNSFVSALALHPKDPKILYAGTNSGVFKTIDGGRHWAAVRLIPDDHPAE